MVLWGVMIGVAVWLSAALFVGDGFCQNKPNTGHRTDKAIPSYDAVYTPEFYSVYTPDFRSTYTPNYTSYYSPEIQKSIESLKSESERSAVRKIIEDLDLKPSNEIFRLTLPAIDVCQEIACLGVSSDKVKGYVEAYWEKRKADEANAIARRSAAAEELNALIAAAALCISLVSLLLSALGYRHTVRSAKSTGPV